MEAFRRTLFESIIDEDLPMEPSDFLKLLQEYQLEDHTPLDMRKSSFKKIGKLLESMSTMKFGEGLIVYQENRIKGHKLITQVIRTTFADFAPKYNLKKIKKKIEESKEETITTGKSKTNAVYP